MSFIVVSIVTTNSSLLNASNVLRRSGSEAMGFWR